MISGTSAGRARDLLGGWDSWWTTTTPVNRMRFQLASFFVLTILAYHYSLSTLLANLSLSSPLAYIGLVPAIALGMGAARSRPQKIEPAIHDRQLDYIVGVPLIGAAMAINLLLPSKLSANFWVWRIDLMSFPLFVAGAVALLFGTRALFRQKLTVGYLLLAWPLPYTLFLLQVLNGFTNVTLAVLSKLVTVFPVASQIPSTDGSLFQVSHHGTTFPLSVVSACSGVDSVVGFLLVGSAFAALVTGPRIRKALWLVGGMALLWAINVGRILFIFWAGQQWGEHTAINILHPFIGLITFSSGVIIMMLVMPLLGLKLGFSTAPVVSAVGKRLAVPNILPAVGLVLVGAMVLGVSNTNLKSYDLVANSAGEAKLASYSADPATPAGWAVNYETAYTWAAPYFGDKSSWLRYLYTSNGAGGNLSATLPITADVINTTDLQSFSAYGVEACYNFHGYTIRDVATVSLPGGITGQALSYSTGASGVWTIVYWIMPIKSAGATHYERVILYLQGTAQSHIGSSSAQAPAGSIKSLQGALDPNKSFDQVLIGNRSFLVSFAGEVIKKQATIQPGTTLANQAPAPAEPASATNAAAAAVTVPAASSAPVARSAGRDPRFTLQMPASYRLQFDTISAHDQSVLRLTHPGWFTGR